VSDAIDVGVEKVLTVTSDNAVSAVNHESNGGLGDISSVKGGGLPYGILCREHHSGKWAGVLLL
jgi:hypothetical protein